MTIIEKILAKHSGQETVKPGDIIDISIDTRAARDFGGANVVKNLLERGLEVDDPSKTYFTFDCNPGGSDQMYAANQHSCRLYARQNNIKVFDVDRGIGTHLAIEEALAWPGSTFVSTDSHANILGSIGSFGQGMGDQDIAAAWAHGSVWFKVPESVKLVLKGEQPQDLSAKDIVLNLLSIYGANQLLGFSVEIEGEAAEGLSLDERLTIASMATEMGAIIILFSPGQMILNELEQLSGRIYETIKADREAIYKFVHEIDVSTFTQKIARPGHPEDTDLIRPEDRIKIDSAFIGSCTNGRMKDLQAAASILKGHKVAPGVILKIVPSTNAIWNEALDTGLIKIFKEAGALISNAGCAGCAAGQIGQNGPKEVTISTGNRNFAGKQGKGSMYLGSPAVVAASAVAGFITTPDNIPLNPAYFEMPVKQQVVNSHKLPVEKPIIVEGRAWVIRKDNIDTDMIFHNQYLSITDMKEMGPHTFSNLEGYEDFANKVNIGDLIFTQKNFGAGSSRQQAVDCFLSLGISAIVAESCGAIYERNAINAALPILTYSKDQLEEAGIEDGNIIRLNLSTGELTNITKNKSQVINKFYDAQMNIYKNGGLL